MDKIFSTRVDESVAALMDHLARTLKKPKKRILEEALRGYAESVDRKKHRDILGETWGSWKRRESAKTTTRKIRREFQESLLRRGR